MRCWFWSFHRISWDCFSKNNTEYGQPCHLSGVTFWSNPIRFDFSSKLNLFFFIPQLHRPSTVHLVATWGTIHPSPLGTRTPLLLRMPPLPCTLRFKLPRSLTIKQLSDTSRWERSHCPVLTLYCYSILHRLFVCIFSFVVLESYGLPPLSRICLLCSKHAKVFCLCRLYGSFCAV